MAEKTKSLTEIDALLQLGMNHVHDVKRRHLITVAILVASILLAVLVIGGIAWYYRDRALPNVSLGNINVSGKTKEEIKQIAQAQKDAISLTFVEDGQEVKATPEDVGINIDVEASANQATWARRNWLDLLLAWEHRDVPLVYTSDLGKAKAFAKEKFPSIVTDAKDAELKFNEQTNAYDIVQGSAGMGFDAVAFVKAVEQLAADPKPISLPLATAPVQPVVQASKLESVKERVDKATDLVFKFTYQGALKYTADPIDIANWTHFTPNPSNGSVTISYDQASVEQFLRDKVGASIAGPPQDKKVVVDQKTGKEIVIQSGREGRELSDVESLAKEVLTALDNGQSLTKEVAVVTAPFTTVTLAGTDRWVEVDLSEQRTSLWLGSQMVQSFTISSGIWKHPTVTGEFAIRYKTPNQVMSGGSKATGDYYYLPNVTWVSYFYEDYAFHTAYWHNNFGHPMSHGCINMRAEDAKTLYDFAPIGTRVIVHA